MISLIEKGGKGLKHFQGQIQWWIQLENESLNRSAINTLELCWITEEPLSRMLIHLIGLRSWDFGEFHWCK